MISLDLILDLMEANFTARKVYGGELNYDVIQQYHQSVFGTYSVSADAWTPNFARNYQSTEAIFRELLNCSNPSTMPFSREINVLFC